MAVEDEHMVPATPVHIALRRPETVDFMLGATPQDGKDRTTKTIWVDFNGQVMPLKTWLSPEQAAACGMKVVEEPPGDVDMVDAEAKAATNGGKQAEPAANGGKQAEPGADAGKQAEPGADAGKQAEPGANEGMQAEPEANGGMQAEPESSNAGKRKSQEPPADTARPEETAAEKPKAESSRPKVADALDQAGLYVCMYIYIIAHISIYHITTYHTISHIPYIYIHVNIYIHISTLPILSLNFYTKYSVPSTDWQAAKKKRRHAMYMRFFRSVRRCLTTIYCESPANQAMFTL